MTFSEGPLFNTATAVRIRQIGFALLVAGGAIVLLALANWAALPNWLAIATMIPVMTALPMIRIDRYQNWQTSQGLERGWAIGALIAPPMLLAGSLIWLAVAPYTHG